MAHRFQFHEKIHDAVVAEAIQWAMRERKMRKSEDQEHRTLMQWARLQRFELGKIAEYLHHSPNGGKRSKAEANNFKLMGTLAGFPDLFLFLPKHGFAGLFIELKADDGSLSAAQEHMIAKLKNAGYDCHVCYGFEAAKRVICQYLDMREAA